MSQNGQNVYANAGGTSIREYVGAENLEEEDNEAQGSDYESNYIAGDAAEEDADAEQYYESNDHLGILCALYKGDNHDSKGFDPFILVTGALVRFIWQWYRSYVQCYAGSACASTP